MFMFFIWVLLGAIFVGVVSYHAEGLIAHGNISEYDRDAFMGFVYAAAVLWPVTLFVALLFVALAGPFVAPWFLGKRLLAKKKLKAKE